jgi:hypothetical protein
MHLSKRCAAIVTTWLEDHAWSLQKSRGDAQDHALIFQDRTERLHAPAPPQASHATGLGYRSTGMVPVRYVGVSPL